MRVCPFWKDKVKMLEYCDPLPEQFTMAGPAGTVPMSFLHQEDGSFLITNSGLKVFYAVDVESVPSEICGDSPNTYVMFGQMADGTVVGVRLYQDSTPVTTFVQDTCTFSETADSLWEIVDSFFVDGSIQYILPPHFDDVNKVLIVRFLRDEPELITRNDVHYMYTTDGVTWNERLATVSTNEEFRDITVQNEDTAIGGFLAGAAPSSGGGSNPLATSSKDMATWTQRGEQVRAINGYSVWSTKYLLYYNDKVIMYNYSNDGNEYLSVLTSYGTVFSHQMAWPTQPDWLDPGDNWYSGAMCYDPASSTLFVVFQNRKINPINSFEYRDNRLFKSSDWGLTWDLVSDLVNINWYWSVCSADWTGVSDYTAGNASMRIYDGYLCLLEDVRYYETSESPPIDAPYFVRLKLEDIV